MIQTSVGNSVEAAMSYFSIRPSARMNVAKPAKSAAAFNALKRDIMLGVLPAGAALTELELAAHFGCSQGTVREALLQLQEEGLVQIGRASCRERVL